MTRSPRSASTQRWPRPAAAQKANPQVFVGQFGDASADKAISKAFEEDFQKAEVLLAPDHAAHPDRRARPARRSRCAAAARHHGCRRHHRPARADQPVPDGRVGRLGRAAGLAVGVDYSMFYLRRKMEERDAGRSSEQALEFAAATSGQAVLISGLTVMIAMAGMFFAGSIVFESFAIGTILVVGIAVLGSLTVLPAVLEARRQGREGPRADHRAHVSPQPRRVPGVWGWILDRVLRRLVLSLVVAGGILVALSIPALGMHTANPGTSGLPRDLEVMKVYDRIQAAFPGGRSRARRGPGRCEQA